MKIALISAILGLSSIALASATCPSETQKVSTCLSTPKADDQEIAANTFDSIAICNQGTKTILVFEKDGESDSAKAKVTRRMGGTSYLIQTADVDFSLSVTTGIRSKTAPAQFKVNFKSNKIIGSSAYTCSR